MSETKKNREAQKKVKDLKDKLAEHYKGVPDLTEKQMLYDIGGMLTHLSSQFEQLLTYLKTEKNDTFKNSQ